MKDKQNALLLSRIDREDYWVSCGLVFPVQKTEYYTETFEEAYQQIKQPEVIKKIRDHYEDEDNEFGEFVDVVWNDYGAEFQFENKKLWFQPDYVFVAGL